MHDFLACRETNSSIKKISEDYRLLDDCSLQQLREICRWRQVKGHATRKRFDRIAKLAAKRNKAFHFFESFISDMKNVATKHGLCSNYFIV